jgi:pimeloyl-ACP methyl ester carboxylesterase
MVQFARGLVAVADRVGPLHAIVGHSLGGAASALAMRQGLGAERAVFIAPPKNPAAYVADFATMLSVAPPALEAMRERIARRLRITWSELDVPAMGAEVDIPLLVVHDRADPTVPWVEGAAIAAAWPGAELVTTEGLGHHAIVNHPRVVQRVLDHVGGPLSRAA